LNNFHDPPILVLGQGPGFNNFYHITDVTGIILIMSFEAGGMPDNRLLHLVAGYFADPCFPVFFHFLLLAKLPLAYYGVYPGDPFPCLGQFAVVNQLPGCQLEAQVKQLLVSFLQFFLQFGVA
jgi:hypothetical protein